ncbi:MAG: carboxypeptidase regulatory-like domain-containing protein [Candidatus Muiribacteriota bacterium]
MKKIIYIILVTTILFAVIGCQSGSETFTSTFFSDSTNVKISGKVTSSLTGVPSAKLTVKPGNKVVYSNNSGEFEVIVPEADEYTIKVEKIGYNTESFLVSNISSTVNIAITKGNLNFSGQVNDDKGNPLESAVLTITSEASAENTFTAQTNSTGQFNFGNMLPDENFSLTIKKDNFFDIEDTVLNTQLGTPATYIMMPSITTEFKAVGKILQKDTSNPISDATIEVMLSESSTPIATTTSDSEGNFVFRNLTQGFYKVKITKKNYVDYIKYFDIVSTDVELGDIEINLTSSGSVDLTEGVRTFSFRIKDAGTDSVINGVIISFRDTIYNQITRDNGEAEFEVPVSQYTVEFRKDGYITQTRFINVVDIPDPDPLPAVIDIFMIYDLVGNLGNIKGKISFSDPSFTPVRDIIITATINTENELGKKITIITVTNEDNEFNYIFRNLQVLYDPDGRKYKYEIEAWYDADPGDGIKDPAEVSFQIVDLEAGKTSIADIMLMAP